MKRSGGYWKRRNGVKNVSRILTGEPSILCQMFRNMETKRHSSNSSFTIKNKGWVAVQIWMLEMAMIYKWTTK